MASITEIKQKIRSGNVTLDELALGILNDKHLLFNYLMDNNLAHVNQTLRLMLGKRYLPFAADRKAIEHEIDMAIAKDDRATMQAIIDDFVRDRSNPNYTNDPKLLAKLKFLK